MTVRLMVGDCRERMAELPAGSVHCVVTSPPYFGLRDYGHAGQIGLEPTPDDFVAAMVAVMRGVRRVLRDDGCAWVVLGDSFGRNPAKGGSGTPNGRNVPEMGYAGGGGGQDGNLLLIPARVALALQQDGWILRQMVTWAKPAPMPESVAGTRWERCRVQEMRTPGAGKQPTNAGSLTAQSGGTALSQWSPCPGCPRCAATDGYVLRRGSWRHTSATEQVLMLVKGMGYWSDQTAVMEAAAYPDDKRKPFAPGQVDYRGNGHDRNGGAIRENAPAGRNPRNWTSPPPSPFSGAHFATYPPKLIEPFIRATCPAKCCPTCGAGWAAVVERETGDAEANGRPKRTAGMDSSTSTLSLSGNGSKEWAERGGRSTVLSHRPTCACPAAAPIPGTVLDPFAGAGTTLLVADRLGRDAIGIELNPDYARIIETRIRADAGMFAEIAV